MYGVVWYDLDLEDYRLYSSSLSLSLFWRRDLLSGIFLSTLGEGLISSASCSSSSVILSFFCHSFSIFSHTGKNVASDIWREKQAANANDLSFLSTTGAEGRQIIIAIEMAVIKNDILIYTITRTRRLECGTW